MEVGAPEHAARPRLLGESVEGEERYAHVLVADPPHFLACPVAEFPLCPIASHGLHQGLLFRDEGWPFSILRLEEPGLRPMCELFLQELALPGRGLERTVRQWILSVARDRDRVDVFTARHDGDLGRQQQILLNRVEQRTILRLNALPKSYETLALLGEGDDGLATVDHLRLGQLQRGQRSSAETEPTACQDHAVVVNVEPLDSASRLKGLQDLEVDVRLPPEIEAEVAVEECGLVLVVLIENVGCLEEAEDGAVLRVADCDLAASAQRERVRKGRSRRL